MAPLSIFWGVLFIVLAIIEIESAQLVSIWMALASLITMFLAIAKVHIVIQIVVFIVLTVILIIATRPLAKKLKAKYVDTNVDLDIGKTAIVTESIENSHLKGRVKLNGVYWAAVSEDGSDIPEGTTVIVTKIDGSKLIVKNS